jgi:hypothetical protein
LGFSEAYPAQINYIHVLSQKAQGEVMLDLGTVNLRGPVPAERIQGFNDGKARHANASLSSTVTPQEGLAFDQLREILNMRLLPGCCLLSEIAVVVSDKRELQVEEMAIEVV